VKKKLAACALIAAWTVVSFGAGIGILEIEKSRASFQGQHTNPRILVRGEFAI
jgi:uncharacterized membrane protein